MNRYNDWENLLRYANEDLEKTGYSLLITEDDEEYFSCEVWKDGEKLGVYAENYPEDELSDLITDAWHHVNTYILKKEENRTAIVVQRTKITPEDIKRTKQVLIDNGIEEDEADAVLQAIGYTLIDTELYPYPECEEYMS